MARIFRIKNKAFRWLAEESLAGRILVTTARRLLGYRRAVCEVGYDSYWDGKKLCIDISRRNTESSVGRLSDSDLNGLTFYVPDPRATCMRIDRQEVIDLKRNAPDHTGQPSVSLAWPLLAFPQV